MSTKVNIKTLRHEAARARASGNYERALSLHLELEALEPHEAVWPQRTADCCRRLGRDADRRAALQRAIDAHVARGHTLKAVALCKMMLAMAPNDPRVMRRLVELQASREHGLARFRPTPSNS